MAGAPGALVAAFLRVAAMIPVPSDVWIWIALGRTDIRRLVLRVQQTLKPDLDAGDIYVFRGRAGSLVKILWHDGTGMKPVFYNTPSNKAGFKTSASFLQPVAEV